MASPSLNTSIRCKICACRGFTLVELMVTVTIVGIVASLGVPSFLEMINQNRATSLANELAASLNLARSEAIKRGLRVTVCKSANISETAANVVCSTTTSWQNGWLIFVDNKGTPGTYDYNIDELLSDALLKVGQLSNNNLTINSSFTNFITYLPSGMSNTFGNFCITVGDKKRKFDISSSGRIRFTKETCS
jgi:type IV fimbrial biogenesis protein FimT